MLRSMSKLRNNRRTPTLGKLLSKRRSQIQAMRKNLANGAANKKGSWNFSLDGRGLGIEINKDGKQFNLQIALPNSNNGQDDGNLPIGTTDSSDETETPVTDNDGGETAEDDGGETDSNNGSPNNGQEESGSVSVDEAEESGMPVPQNGVNEQPADDSNANSSSNEETPSAGEMAFENAATSFKSGNWATSLAQINTAAVAIPDNANVLQFLSLAQFARKDYARAASAAKKALVLEAGWDWETLKSLYSSTSEYTTQYRALETHCGNRPTDADARFLLGYHYLMCGHTESAKTELAAAATHAPKDAVITALYRAVSQAGK